MESLLEYHEFINKNNRSLRENLILIQKKMKDEGISWLDQVEFVIKELIPLDMEDGVAENLLSSCLEETYEKGIVNTYNEDFYNVFLRIIIKENIKIKWETVK